MKRIIAIMAVVVLACVLAGCEKATLNIDSDDTGVHVVAKNGFDGSGTGTITIPPDYGLCVNHIVEKGSFHVTVTDKQDTIVFDADIDNNIADLTPVSGEFIVTITAKRATGTIDIIAYDIEAQAQADAALPEALAQAGVEEKR